MRTIQTASHINPGSLPVEVTLPDGSAEQRQMEPLGPLGRGRSGEVHLVRDNRTGTLYAEKLFKVEDNLATLGRNVLYWLCFQAPFPYQTDYDAVRAAMFRRRLLRDLTEFWFGKPLIADANYTRWDPVAPGYILGTEYIPGHGPRPGTFNPLAFRNLFHNYLVRFVKRLAGIRSPRFEGNPWDIDEAARHLDRLKNCFRRAGFLGSEWQVEKRLSVPTSNLHKDEKGDWVLIDVESGMPALLMFHRIWAATKIKALPLFDDLDFTRMRQYLKDNQSEIEDRLGQRRFQTINDNADRLQSHTEAWKSSEPALFRHGCRLIINSDLRTRIRRRFIEHWRKTGLISPQKARKVEGSNLLFNLCFTRDLLKSFLRGAGTLWRSLTGFVASFARSVTLALRLLWSAFFNDTYIKEFARFYVIDRIEDWHQSGRLTDEEASLLRERVSSPTIAEYLKGFMVHLGLNLLEPPFIGNIIVLSLFLIFHQPFILIFIFMGPVLRTLYTLVRLAQNRGKGISYGTALITGALPKVGTIAYPLQMATTHPNVSRFLARWELSNFGRHMPLFGGFDSRLEHSAIKTADLGSSMNFEYLNMMGRLRPVRGRKG